MRKFTLNSDLDAELFVMDVLRGNGDAFRWPGTETVVVRGDVPSGYELKEEHVTEDDRLRMWVGWA